MMNWDGELVQSNACLEKQKDGPIIQVSKFFMNWNPGFWHLLVFKKTFNLLAGSITKREFWLEKDTAWKYGEVDEVKVECFCKKLKVTGDDSAFTGIYTLSDEIASKSPDYPVYELVKGSDGELCSYIYF